MHTEYKGTKIILAAGGTGGHIFPALSVALELKKRIPQIVLIWIGTTRSREKELCEKNSITFIPLDVEGINRKNIVKIIKAFVKLIKSIFVMNSIIKKEKPKAIIAFGGYVCAPVLCSGYLYRVPYFIQEQNTVLGIVNRIFFKKAVKTFLGFPLAYDKKINGKIEITGNPIRENKKNYENYPYPQTFEKNKTTLLICGGSQGAQSMNNLLIPCIEKWLNNGWQIIWQTGPVSYNILASQFKNKKGIYLFDVLEDLYPYYAVSKLVIGRAGASTIAEISYFGLPCILIPLPWAANNHQWINAGFVEQQGWGIRIKQDNNCAKNVEKAVEYILTNENIYKSMCMKAVDNSHINAASKITQIILKELNI